MKFGIVGNREGWTYEQVKKVLQRYCIGDGIGDSLVSGGARGVDSFAQRFAEERGLTITICYPDPKKPSPFRYYERNEKIVNSCDALFAFNLKGDVGGTANTIHYAKSRDKIIVEITEVE